MKLPILSTALLLVAGSVSAQTGMISFDDPVEPTNSYYQSYAFNHAGDIETHAYKPFTVVVDYGTGAASSLVGETYLAFCVNPVYTTPGAGTSFNYATNASVLSYDINGVDYWSINATAKYDALKDIFATYANQLLTLDPASQESAYLNTAIGLAISEIVMDYDGTFASFNLNSGNSIVTNPDFTAISGAVLDYYSGITSVVGSGVGKGFTLHAAGENTHNSQDLVFFNVPEPGSAFLLLTAGLGLIFRRRRLN